MKAIEKIDALSVKVVHAHCERSQPGLAVETVYRWRQALKAGKGISDRRKALLIEATAATEHAIAWPDFVPVSAGAEPSVVSEARS